MGCGKSQGFLAQHGLAVSEQVNANKEKLGAADALRLARAAAEVVVAKGKKIVRFNMKKDAPTDEELLKAMLGPTGNLRAPTVRAGKRLLVGFNEEAYEAIK